MIQAQAISEYMYQVLKQEKIDSNKLALVIYKRSNKIMLMVICYSMNDTSKFHHQSIIYNAITSSTFAKKIDTGVKVFPIELSIDHITTQFGSKCIILSKLRNETGQSYILNATIDKF